MWNMILMRNPLSTLGAGLFLFVTTFHAGCAPKGESDDPRMQRPGFVMEPANTCALSGEPLSGQTSIRTFAGEDIFFRSEAQAAAFDEMPGGAKRVIAGRQLLDRRGVINEYCPLSQEPLPLDAGVLEYRSVLIGFIDQKHLDQFNALPEDVTLRICARYLLEADGIANNRCPITDELLLPDAPVWEDERYKIAFSDTAALATFNALARPRRNELTARIILPDQGVANVICPITERPVRLDSPIINIEGRDIALRNVDAARAFNKLTRAEQVRYAYPEDEH
ncbi:MAG: hypothetical protein CMJ53_00245 [Planctomycetaceae bacterium]|nr:hypothetical protein [Planctomycetaceae bacterium]